MGLELHYLESQLRFEFSVRVYRSSDVLWTHSVSCCWVIDHWLKALKLFCVSSPTAPRCHPRIRLYVVSKSGEHWFIHFLFGIFCSACGWSFEADLIQCRKTKEAAAHRHPFQWALNTCRENAELLKLLSGRHPLPERHWAWRRHMPSSAPPSSPPPP